MPSANSRFLGWRMVAIALLAQNCALGLPAGSYSTVLASFQAQFGVSRAAVSSALGIMYASMGLLSPFAGVLLQRFSVRRVMIFAAGLSGAAYCALAFANSNFLVSVIFALLVGPGACLLSALPVSTLISRWFERERGRALGIATMPLFLLFIPPLASQIVMVGGPRALFLVFAGMFALLILPLMGVIDRPEDVGQVARPRAADAGVRLKVSAQASSTRTLLRDPRFWLLSIGIGIMAGMGAAFVTHAVPIATFKGASSAAAATLISAFGLGTLAGGICFGWLADRIGAIATLMVNATIQVALWLALIQVETLPTMLIISGLLGACLGATVALHAAAINELYGAENISRALGLSWFVKTPLLLSLAPLNGLLYDIGGSYSFALGLDAGALGLAALLFGLLARNVRRLDMVSVAE